MQAQLQNEKQSVGFIQNEGQLLNTNNTHATEVKYYSKANGNSYFWNEDASLNICNSQPDSNNLLDNYYRIDMNFIDHNSQVEIEGVDQLYYLNYYLAQSGNSFEEVPVLREVNFNNLYSGISLKSSMSSSTDLLFEVSENTDPAQIRFNIDGSTNFVMPSSGGFKAESPYGFWQIDTLFAYQLINGHPTQVAISFLNNGGILSFNLGTYSANAKLFISLSSFNTIPSPTNPLPLNINWSTSIEQIGGAADGVNDVYLTPSDTLYTAGYCTNILKPALYGQNTTHTALWDAFVFKFEPGRNIKWGSYFGGNNQDMAVKVQSTPDGYVYLYGLTTSSDISVVTCATCAFHLSNSLSGSTDAFLVKFSADGKYKSTISNTFATLVGGNNDEMPGGMVVNSLGDVFISGSTNSTTATFPLLNNGTGYFQNILPSTVGAPNQDGFIMKINHNNSLSWSTALGGYDTQYASWSAEALGDLAIDKAGNICANGYTTSNSYNYTASGAYTPLGGINTSGLIPIVHSSATSFNKSNSGLIDALLVKFDDLGRITWSTCFGGSSFDNVASTSPSNIYNVKYSNHIAADKFGNTFVAGNTYSVGSNEQAVNGFPIVQNNIPNGFNSSANSNLGTSYLSRFNARNELDWSAFFPTTGARIHDISIGNTPYLYVVGRIENNTLPTKQIPNSYFRNFYNNYSPDGFIAQFTSSNLNYNYCTYYGSHDKTYQSSIHNLINAICASTTANNIYQNQFVIGGSIDGSNNFPFLSRPGPLDYFFSYPGCNSPFNCPAAKIFITNFYEVCKNCARIGDRSNDENSGIKYLHYNQGILTFETQENKLINGFGIYSIIGSLVKKVSIVNISNSYTMPINLQAGLYLTRFNFADGSSSENKFIVK